MIDTTEKDLINKLPCFSCRCKEICKIRDEMRIIAEYALANYPDLADNVQFKCKHMYIVDHQQLANWRDA